MSEYSEVVEKASKLAAAAFLHTSSYVAVYHGLDDIQREHELQWLFQRNFELMDPRYQRFFYKDYNYDQLKCFYMIVPSNDATLSMWKKISGGMLNLLFRAGGFPVVRRVIEVSDWIDAEITSCMAPEIPYLTLQRMVVSPDLQGQGVGTNCLRLALREADTEGLPIVLSTQDEKNVIFYSRLGFCEVKRKVFVDSYNSSISFLSIFMVRQPIKLNLCWLVKPSSDVSKAHDMDSNITNNLEKFTILKYPVEWTSETPVLNPLDPKYATSPLFSVTRTQEEISVVVADSLLSSLNNSSLSSSAIEAEDGWVAFRVQGSLDFSLIGIIAGISESLAEAGISLFVSSTYLTDYVLIKSTQSIKAQNCLLKRNRYAFVQTI